MPQYQEMINALWHQMRQDFAHYIVPVRDFARWVYRYVNHPELTYQVILITARFSKKPLAAFVIIEHPDFIELVDYVGGRAGVDLAIDGVRQCATRLGKTFAKGWFTNSIVSQFEAQCSSVTKTGIEVPINLRGKTKAQAVLPAPLWLMAGDSDFR